MVHLIAQGISGSLDQQVTVHSRPTGVIPGETVAKALADGYTLPVVASRFWIRPLLPTAPYDRVTDFSPIT